jgi:hypothetical protein
MKSSDRLKAAEPLIAIGSLISFVRHFWLYSYKRTHFKGCRCASEIFAARRAQRAAARVARFSGVANGQD